jgi:hypothetical protein
VLCALLVAGTVLLPVAWLLPEALGAFGLALATSVVALLTGALGSLVPPTQGLKLACYGGLAAVLGLAFVAFLPEPPSPLNVELHHDATTGTSRWWITSPAQEAPEAIRQALPEQAAPFPWSGEARGWRKPATVPTPPPPEWEVQDAVLDGARRRIRALVRSPRRAPELNLFLPPNARVAGATVMGVPAVFDAREEMNGWRRLSVASVPAEGVVVELTLEGTEPLDVLLMDTSPGVPPEGEALQRVRTEHAIPTGEGDVTRVLQRLKL